MILYKNIDDYTCIIIVFLSWFIQGCTIKYFTNYNYWSLFIYQISIIFISRDVIELIFDYVLLWNRNCRHLSSHTMKYQISFDIPKNVIFKIEHSYWVLLGMFIRSCYCLRIFHETIELNDLGVLDWKLRSSIT